MTANPCQTSWNGQRVSFLFTAAQVLAQVNFYMKQHNARHGAVLPDEGFLAVKRLSANGGLAMAEPVAWSDGAGEGRLILAAFAIEEIMGKLEVTQAQYQLMATQNKQIIDELGAL